MNGRTRICPYEINLHGARHGVRGPNLPAALRPQDGAIRFAQHKLDARGRKQKLIVESAGEELSGAASLARAGFEVEREMCEGSGLGGGGDRNSKSQHPNSKKAPNPKL